MPPAVRIMVFLGEFFFAGDQDVNSIVALLADYQATLAHLLLSEAVHIPLHPSRSSRSSRTVVFRLSLEIEVNHAREVTGVNRRFLFGSMP
jgi:hypothetical protein